MFEYSPDKGGHLSIAHVFIVLIMQAQFIFSLYLSAGLFLLHH